MRVVVSTVVSADYYAYYIPLFIYSLKRAYPDYGIKIFLRGKLNEDVQEALKLIEGDYDIYEDSFLTYPTRVSTCNTLRHLLPPKRFKDYDYLYITDIDFIFFPHDPTVGRYFQKRIQEGKQPYASFRGPLSRPRRPEINHNGWRGNFQRIADGTLMLKIPKWFDRIYVQRKKYKNLAKKSKHDNYDHYKPCSYREYNEVMLYRMVKNSGMKTPDKKNKFITGKPYNKLYRDIHLGDFKFERRKIRKYIHYKNVKAFKRLQKDPIWKKICEICERNKKIRQNMGRLRKYVKKV